ncbi:hypothetical protein AB6A40_003157 [Gnathostoma spinigerum]|uniref:Probable RNA polymerase II nuclear localization protein SLC7A6OS n=1 Tax=Gnathostoma spinigerum TaxID=75299 RepID=A0ABD6E8P9_9BILA
MSSPLFSPVSSQTTIFRIRRKRTADPHEAVVVCPKKVRQEQKGCARVAPFFIRLSKTHDQPDVSGIGIPDDVEVNVVDVDPEHTSMQDCKDIEMNSNVAEISSLLASLCGAVGEGAQPEQKDEKRFTDQITLNGVPMCSTSASKNDYVYDFYWTDKCDVFEPSIMEVRLAKDEEVEYYMNEDTDSITEADDDSDSNAENNWRNDYPDEDEGKDRRFSDNLDGEIDESDNSSEEECEYDDYDEFDFL